MREFNVGKFYDVFVCFCRCERVISKDKFGLSRSLYYLLKKGVNDWGRLCYLLVFICIWKEVYVFFFVCMWKRICMRNIDVEWGEFYIILVKDCLYFKYKIVLEYLFLYKLLYFKCSICLFWDSIVYRGVLW